MIVICDHDNLDAWLALRTALWPSSSPEDHRAEMREILASPHHTAFMARGLDGAFVGFAEVALRYDYVNGCESSPVAFLEGIYTVERARRQGLGRTLDRTGAGVGEAAGGAASWRRIPTSPIWTPSACMRRWALPKRSGWCFTAKRWADQAVLLCR